VPTFWRNLTLPASRWRQCCLRNVGTIVPEYS
jgi:hypothetical protein